MAILRLQNPLLRYAWGAADFIPDLLGQKSDSDHPVAEMWIGAHAQAPSLVNGKDGKIPLDVFISRDPKAALGQAAQLYNGKLPFLMKVLAAERPLSIQAHPSKLQAEKGFARENRLGLALDSPLRNYRDDNHKPELICALTPFRALCGFRDHREIAANFRVAGLSGFFRTINALEQSPAQSELRGFLLELLNLPEPDRKDVFTTLFDAQDRMAALPAEIVRICRDLATHFPGDIGILAPLFLNIHKLRPGEALYLGPGVLHSYVEGAGIEIMANSDNVRRGGLTPKHVDVAELVNILDFSTAPRVKILPMSDSSDSVVYPCPAREFSLRCLDWIQRCETVWETENRPLLMLSVAGRFSLQDKETEVTLKKGDSVFVPANTGKIKIAGRGKLWQASVPADQS